MTTELIECSNCKAKVQANVLARREYGPGAEWDPHAFAFVECTTCKIVMVGFAEFMPLSPEEDGWTMLSRQWPDPKQTFDIAIPREVRKSLEEARKCFECGAYMACAVMCGRAIEAICQDKTHGKSKTLAKGLAALKDQKVIDAKLYEWSEALRKERNIGAHAGDASTSSRDARDVFDFAIAISEYVYVLEEKYQEYQQRKEKKKSGKVT